MKFRSQVFTGPNEQGGLIDDLGLSADESTDIFKLVAVVLKLGNIKFVPSTNMDGTEGCVIGNEYGEESLFKYSFEHGILQLTYQINTSTHMKR